MSRIPLHPLAPGTYPRTGDLSPTGLPCPEHASMTLDDRCYWHAKAAHLRGEHVSLEARQWCGFDLPQPNPGWRTDRGWRALPDELRALRTDARDQYDEVVEDMRIVLSVGTTRRLEAER